MNREHLARQRRRAAASRYRPAVIDTLLVAEAPPSALDRYFYFEDVDVHDSLFRHVVQAVLGERPTRDKAPYLDELKQRGWFLIDMSEDPFRDRAVLRLLVPDLVARCQELSPRRIVLIGAGLFDLVCRPLERAGLPVVRARLPFPGSGQQTRFLEMFADLIDLRED